MEKQTNQCDGCARNLNIEEGIHYYISSQGNKIYDNACTKDRYVEKETEKMCFEKPCEKCSRADCICPSILAQKYSQKENNWEEEFEKKFLEPDFYADVSKPNGVIHAQRRFLSFAEPKEVINLIRSLLTQAIKEERERIANGIGSLSGYYRSKFSQDCSRNETEEEKNTEMVELSDVFSVISKENE